MAAPVATGPLLERSAELARIESALADARNRRGRLVVVEGPAGIGKTALLAAARAAAAASNLRVLRSSGSELERDFAFGIVRQLFEPPLAEAPPSELTDLLADREYHIRVSARDPFGNVGTATGTVKTLP